MLALRFIVTEKYQTYEYGLQTFSHITGAED